ncbi:MAG: 16S rRNA (cytosine(967)-C(5))-methyltransferase [candidate division Zixibacteria bacterium RBG_16_53_22]|nr:MAG: 16S rRNA (cytosine(967)-C(5))-methyltransferase [candidate division Zixibacteria bacterium RBG_16_53_22]
MKGRTLSRSLAWTALLEFQKTEGDLDRILDDLAHSGIPERDRALAWEITKGVVKYMRKLDYVAQSFMKAPIGKQKPGVVAALRTGLYQLTEMAGIAQYAAVDETVGLLSETGMKRDAGFVNAVLRAYIREPEKAKFPDKTAEPGRFLGTYYSYPDWLVKRWLKRLGFDEAERIMIAFNRRPPVFFKTLAGEASAESVLRTLGELGITIEPGKFMPGYFSSTQVYEILNSEPFHQGRLIAQDESQGLPIQLLDPTKGAVVLDLCSAPGGKTVALADIVGPEGKVVSVDRDYKRLEFVKQAAARAGLANVEFICDDVLQFAPERKFGYILLDVPCSGLGTLWSNVDIRWTKKESDIKTLARLQLKMLEKAAQLAANGGRIVYSTCTTEPDEIENIVADFLKNNRQFRTERSKNDMLKPFEEPDSLYRTWPHKHGIGGGGFALLVKGDEN